MSFGMYIKQATTKEMMAAIPGAPALISFTGPRSIGTREGEEEPQHITSLSCKRIAQT